MTRPSSSILQPGIFIIALLSMSFLLTSRFYLVPTVETGVLIAASVLSALNGFMIIRRIYHAVLGPTRPWVLVATTLLITAVIAGGILISILASRANGIFTTYEGSIRLKKPTIIIYVYRSGMTNFSFTELRYSTGMELVSHGITGLQLGNSPLAALQVRSEDSCTLISNKKNAYRFFPSTQRLVQLDPIP